MRPSRLAAVAVTAVAAAVLITPPASAETLAGEWAAFGNCPVDAPTMLAADGVDVVATCLAGGAPEGTIDMGDSTLPVGTVDMQYGLLNRGGTYTLVVPANGGLSGEPINVPGGLLGLMCPSDIPVISQICDAVVGSPLNTVTATLEPAGAPTNFDLSAATAVGRPIMTIPVKVHLQNPFLAGTCYIGSNQDPIRLTVSNQTRPTARFVRFNADGTPNPTGEMNYLQLSGATMGDTTFAVPGARGCGLFGLIDSVVNGRQGLPSPAGENSLVLNNTTFKVGGFQNPRAFAPTQGRQLADRWHAAVVD
jgi:hypothetical protein